MPEPRYLATIISKYRGALAFGAPIALALAAIGNDGRAGGGGNDRNNVGWGSVAAGGGGAIEPERRMIYIGKIKRSSRRCVLNDTIPHISALLYVFQ